MSHALSFVLYMRSLRNVNANKGPNIWPGDGQAVLTARSPYCSSMNLMTSFSVQSLSTYNLMISSLQRCQSLVVANRAHGRERMAGLFAKPLRLNRPSTPSHHLSEL